MRELSIIEVEACAGGGLIRKALEVVADTKAIKRNPVGFAFGVAAGAILSLMGDDD